MKKKQKIRTTHSISIEISTFRISFFLLSLSNLIWCMKILKISKKKHFNSMENVIKNCHCHHHHHQTYIFLLFHPVEIFECKYKFFFWQKTGWIEYWKKKDKNENKIPKNQFESVTHLKRNDIFATYIHMASLIFWQIQILVFFCIAFSLRTIIIIMWEKKFPCFYSICHNGFFF